MNSESNVPHFDPPLPISLFLKSSANTYIYDDLRQFEHHFLHFLKKIDYDYTKPLALSAPSSDELVFILASCWRLGIPFVPIDYKLSQKEQLVLLNQLDIELLITDQETSNLSLQSANIEQFSLSKILSPDFTPKEWVAEHKESVKPAQLFGYFFTSGTTGSPKIVPLKRRQMLYAAQASSQNLQPRRNHLWLLCLPLHHIGGISVILRSLLYGSGIYRMDKFNPTKTIALISQYKQLVAASMVPTMLNRLMNRNDFAAHDNFQAILLGGGPITPSLIDDCFNRGIPIITSYGMTESCAQIAANPLKTVGDLSRPKKSVGKVFDPNNIDIRNDEGHSVEPSVSGQIWLKGPQIFDGYLINNNADFFDSEGWFNTGDYGYLNDQNELFIEARRTDLIISGGENIAPLEVENALEALPNIEEAAVVGLPDEKWGQKVVAIVKTTNNQKIKSGTIQKLLKDHLQSFKIPKEIVQVDSIPISKTGKIKRLKAKEYFDK
ncbi:o-succinylbenzoate--CoA ligase [Aliifodinibius salicampi]|uniref:O-succinylbenzoate--CoA ligase n=1 Tax=Fodinibius salicampi TaxID=1920655 RepID=A0ABT3PW22_9BACT|nr:o-succinylbenzoate--CoA ligase [Fodinibius salicampi]MCW9712055.1 o-succinylbenzoate--CoA ligase [Fodinibius salicampi]